MFDVIQFLEQYRIPYTETRDGFVIQCPFCGSKDQGQHLAWNPSKGWHCWRNPQHAGRRPHYLVMRLAKCSLEQAEAIVKSRGISPNTSQDKLLELLGRKIKANDSPKKLTIPKEFKPLTIKGSGLHYSRYLINRGFKESALPELVDNYQLMYCTSGPWRHRIIFPIYLRNRLVTWIGRTISSTDNLRYLSLGEDDLEQSPQFKALQTTKSVVYNYDVLLGGGKTLVLVEGPFDALKVDFYGERHGVRATCLFGTGITEDQIHLIERLKRRFEQLAILGDRKADVNVYHIIRTLRRVDPKIKMLQLPAGVKDPGEMTRQQVKQMAEMK